MNKIEQLKTASENIKKSRPSYESILDFYTRIFMAQEENKQDINISPVKIDDDLLKIKQKNELPLIDQSEFSVDPIAADYLFLTICDLARNHAPKLSQSAAILKQADLNGSLDLETLFSSILNQQHSAIEEMGRYLSVSADELLLFGHLSIIPSLQCCSESLSTYLKNTPDLKKGYCPICGNHPDLAFLDEKGRRHLICRFCTHEWTARRMGCVFCDDNSKDLQHYFYSNEEKEYRVCLCDNCHHYIKLVDLRQLNRSFHPNLEMISTLHLDIKAQELGYRNNGFSGEKNL